MPFRCSVSEQCASHSNEANETKSESNVLGASFNDVHHSFRVIRSIVIVVTKALVENKALVRVSDLVKDRLCLIKGAEIVLIAMQESDRHPVDCSKVNNL